MQWVTLFVVMQMFASKMNSCQGSWGKKSGMSWSLSLFWKLFVLVLSKLFPWSWLQCGELFVTVFADTFLRLAGLHFKSPWCLFACGVCNVTSVMRMNYFLGIYPSPTANVRSWVVLVPTFVLQTHLFSPYSLKRLNYQLKWGKMLSDRLSFHYHAVLNVVCFCTLAKHILQKVLCGFLDLCALRWKLLLMLCMFVKILLMLFSPH